MVSQKSLSNFYITFFIKEHFSSSFFKWRITSGISFTLSFFVIILLLFFAKVSNSWLFFRWFDRFLCTEHFTCFKILWRFIIIFFRVLHIRKVLFIVDFFLYVIVIMLRKVNTPVFHSIEIEENIWLGTTICLKGIWL